MTDASILPLDSYFHYRVENKGRVATALQLGRNIKFFFKDELGVGLLSKVA